MWEISQKNKISKQNNESEKPSANKGQNLNAVEFYKHLSRPTKINKMVCIWWQEADIVRKRKESTPTM